MTKKEKFINMVEDLVKELDLSEYQEEMEFFNSLKETKEKAPITEKGLKILNYMKEHKEEYNNIFKAADIGAGLEISGKSVSGSIRKLVESNFVKKVGSNPSCYSLTEVGEAFEYIIIKEEKGEN
jgi:DNA-binding MarR family transcriptional regulator